ncbi:hypothetical protein [Verticiella alkaliphila]|uniref:hypothetical protein n=1 Tax=Verticiella alkaliphila TaxID=2779529 RepID=UPI00273A5753|nr:hypothetical protein [Verticiella sp. GG226]
MTSTSPLSTLLATRLDAVLGTTLAQHTTLLDVRPNQAALATSALHPQDNVIRRAPDPAADAAAKGARRAGAELASQDRASTPGADRATVPASARAILSEPAKAILALLVARPDVAPGVRGAVPMLRLAAASVHLPPPGGLPTRGSAPPTQATGARDASAAAAGARGAAGAASGGAQPGSASTAASSAAVRAASLLDTALTDAATTGRGAPPSGSGGSAVGAGAPLTVAPAFSSPMAQALATALARSVGESGLFYESHLSQLAFGQRKPETLLREPQALLGRPSTPDTPQTPGTDAGRAGAEGSPTARSESAPLRAFESLANTAAPQAPAAPVPGLHADATAMVRQQLEVLAHANFQWQGQAWEARRCNGKSLSIPGPRVRHQPLGQRASHWIFRGWGPSKPGCRSPGASWCCVLLPTTHTAP